MAIRGERFANGGKVLAAFLKRSGRPFSCSELDASRYAVGHDVNGVEPFVAIEGSGNLLRRRPAIIQQDGPDFRPQIAENSLPVGD
nr:hypothetical protein [Mesorhizobium sp.]